MKLTHPPACGFPFWKMFARIKWSFYFIFLTSPQLWAIKECDVHAPGRWLFLEASLHPLSFLNKVVFFASTPHLSDLLAYGAVSRGSLDLVTVSLNLLHSSLGWVRCLEPFLSSFFAVSTLRNFRSIDSITISMLIISKFVFMSLTILPTSRKKKSVFGS